MATQNYDQNGLIFQRRVSRAYDQPIVQHTSKGMVVRPDDKGSADLNASGVDGFGVRFEAIGGMVAKGTLGSLTVLGALVSLMGKASLDLASQLFGFMLILVVTFVACSGLFYWWGCTNKVKVGLSVKKVSYVYFGCVSCDLFARVVNIFTAVPSASAIPADISYYVIDATLLLFVFSLFIHKEGLNAMFAQENLFFVVCTIVFNFSSTCLFQAILPAFLIPQMVYASILLGLSLSLAGYRLPRISLSRIYWSLNQSEPARPIVSVEPPLPTVSVDHSGSQSHRESLSSTVSSMKHRHSFSSLSSINSMNPQGYESEVAVEAHGLLADLLLSKEALPATTQQKLRRIKDILAPRIDRILSRPKVSTDNYIDQDDHDYETDVSSALSSSRATPTSGRHSKFLTVQSSNRHHKGRSVSVVHMGRSATDFSTTTNATGMPVLEREPADRARSLALRDVKARISVQEKRHSVHRLGRDRVGSDSSLRPRSAGSRAEKSSLTTTLSANVSESELSEAESTGSALSSASSPLLCQREDKAGSRQPVATLPARRTSNARVGSFEDAHNLAIIKESTEQEELGERPRSATLPGDVKFSNFEKMAERNGLDMVDEVGKKVQEEGEDDKVFSQGKIGDHKFYSFTRYRRPSGMCDLSEYTSNEHLDMFENVAVWDYPIFELEEKAGNHILSHMAHMLFHEAGLMETFQIPQREFVNYFRALEANYGSNVYHNKTHAADVLHAVSYLMFEIIPEFTYEFSYGEEEQREWRGHSRLKSSGGNIASAFSILEVLACYMAASMHDFDHPGRTNAFLVGTRAPLALLYNDRSVLENHHAAASWHLLNNFEENNFLVSMEEAELKRLRFLIIEGILATDLKMHFDILSTFRAKVNHEDGGGIDWNSEVDRMLVMKMIIKMADINTPTKSFDLHRKWTTRITEEFYQQSEEEERLNLPATIFMDRRHPEKLPAVQLSFIQHLVSPLFQACAEAGIIPGILEPVQAESTPGEGGEQKQQQEQQRGQEDAPQGGSSRPADGVDDIADDAFSMEPEQPSTKFMSIILTNLQINYDGWKAELPPEDEDKTKKEEKNEDKDDVQDKEASTEGDDKPSTAVTSDDTSTPPVPNSDD